MSSKDKMDLEVLRLIPKKRKGLLGLVFSRVGITIILVLIEVLVLFTFFAVFAGDNWWLMLLQGAFELTMILYLFNCSMDSSPKLTWLVLIVIFPVPASILLWLTKKDIGHMKLKKRLELMIRETKKKLPQNPYTIIEDDIIMSGTDDLVHYLNRTGCFPLYENTQVKFFPLGEYKFRSVIDELQKAEKFIFLEYFILDEGYMWGSILNILAQKAAAGVDVRVMYDGMCEISTLTSDYPQRMAKLGIKCKPFSPIRPFFSTHYNYRDHRKILVIDGKVAYTGGVNLADEYINRINRFGHWKDTAVMLKGEAVQSFTLMFLQMWNLTERELRWDECEIRIPEASDGFVIPFCDSPLDENKVGERVYMDIINHARSYVHIMTPYLILDNEMEDALKYAAERGVDIKIILPGIPDKKGAYALAKSHYKSLLKAGVRLYEYTPGFVHAKIFVSDNEKAVVGTINLDYRSLYHHFECGTYLFKNSSIAEIEKDYSQTLKKCCEITKDNYKEKGKGWFVLGGVMKLIAPMM